VTLYTDTPMGKAVLELVENLSYLLAEKGNPPGTCRAYIFGGCALHLHTKARGSSDLDGFYPVSTDGFKTADSF